MDNSGCNCNGETRATKGWGRTKIEKQTFTYTWVIDQFPLWLNEIAEAQEFSPTFFAGGLQWCLELNTSQIDDDEEEDENGFSLTLVCIAQGLQSKVLTDFKLGILDDKGKQVFVHDSPKRVLFNTKQNCYGWQPFIRKVDLFNKENRIFPNNTLTLFCEINTFGPSFVSGSGSYTSLDPQPKVILPESHLTSNFHNFLQSQFLSDVILAIGAKEFPSHKLMLAGASPVFAAMFGHDMKENLGSRVEVKDIDASVFEEFLHFIYTGKVNDLEKNAEDLLVVAERYGVERLKAICEESLATQLSVENIVHIHGLAHLNNANQLKAVIMNFFKEHSSEISMSDGFFSLMVQEMTLTEKNS